MKTIKSCLLFAFAASMQVVLAADPCYVDVLFAVDAKASAYLQDEKELTVDQYAANQLAGMNAVLTNSGLHTSFLFRSAGAYELGFEAKLVDSGKKLTRDVLENATGGKGIWEDLHTERDNRGADVVSVIIDTGSEYGHVGDGNALTNLSAAAAFSESAYSVVGVRSTFAYHAVLHEIAHNMGAGHAAEVGTGSHATSAAYGYYFTGNTKSYYTVMGYPKSGYSPAPVFSTPDKQYDGVAAGTTTKDNVSVLKQTCQAASQWRSLPAKAHPTMTVAWHQHAPFNSFAPVIGSDADVPCGCAATAAAQMFKHYAWPVRIGSVFEGKTQKYVGNTPEAFPIRLDGHNDFLWAKMNDNASANDAAGNFEAARMTLWCDAMAGMDFRSGDSSANFDDIAENASQWYQKGKSTYYLSDGADAIFKALTNALDRGELVQVTLKGHQVVADAYRFNAGNLEVHLNYGWAGYKTGWYTREQLEDEYAGILYVWTGFTPKKTAQLKPLPKQVASTGTIPLNWAVPQKHADDLTGFMIMAYYPSDTLQKTFAGSTGTMAADRVGIYNLTGAFGLTGNSKLSYTLSSYHTSGIKVELQARFDADEWTTIDTPEVSTKEDEYDKGVLISTGWMADTNEVDLASYAGKTAEFRFKVSRTAKTRTKDGELFFSAPVWTQVYSPASQPLGLQGQVYKTLRSCPLSASGYAGKVVSFTIEPIMADSVVSEPVATKVVATSVPAQPAVVSVEGVTDGFRRTCGIGKNEFIVNVNETTTKVTALPSHLALVGDDDVVEVTDLGNQTWSVAIDATDVPENSQLILTFCAEDALGNKAYKDLQLTFKEGGEEPEEPAYDAEVLATFYGFDTPTSGNYTVTLDNGDYRFSSATAWNGNSDGLSVLVRYSGYVQPTANAFLITLKNSAVGSGAANALGVFAQATDGTIHGVWNNATWTGSDKDASKVQVCDKTVPAEGYLVLTYKGSEKTKLHASDGTVLYEASALRTSASDQQIGDLVTVGSASATMTVEGVRIFKGALAKDEIAAAVEDFEKDMPEPLDEMYHNRLSGGSEVVPAGWYGAIAVPANGYKATAFGAATQLANTESDDEVVGSYANIITKEGSDWDLREHTVAGWFKVDALPDVAGEGNAKTIYVAKNGNSQYGGYKVAVDSVGKILVGQCDNEAWRATKVSTTAAHVEPGEWFHLAVAVDGRTDSNRDSAVAIFINGQAVVTTDSKIKTNLNGGSAVLYIGGKSVTSGLGISAAGIYVDKAALDDARTVVYVAKHVPVEVPAVRPDIIKDPTTHTWTVDTTKIGYAFTSSEIAEMKATAWKVALKSASEYGATVDFGTVSGAQKSHFVIENGSHAMVWTNGNSNINFNTDGTDDDPSILVKGGATLNFTVRDFTGWEGNAAKKKGNVVRVNGGGTLNLIQYKTSEKGYTHYYQGRYWLDPGASVVADFAGDQFRLNGGAIEGCEQLYVPDSEEGASAATLTVLHKLCIAKDTTAGVGVYVGTHSTLEINADITSNSANPLEKWGAGTLGINGSLADFTGALTVHAGTLKLAENVIGGSLVMDAGTTIDIAHEGEIADGTVLLTAGSIDIGNATLLVNGKLAPEVHVSGGKLKVGKPPITTLLNPYAVTEGGVIKVSCNAEAPTSEAAKAYDGNTATYFAPGDAANAKGVSWTGIAFTNGVIVTEIVFSSHYARRMIGGAFQGANLADYSDATNVYVVESYSGGTANVELPEAKGPYKYLRFIGMYGGNASEIKYYGLADSGAVAPTNAPTVLASWSTNGVAGLTLKPDAAIPQVYVVQRAMRNFCDPDGSDYETCVTLAPQLGETMTWTDGEATGYALYRMQGRNVNGASTWTYFEIEPEKLIAGPVAPTFKGNGPGFYASEASVEIAYGVPGAQIYYTLDGSTPTTNSTLYAGAIVLGDVCGQENPLSQIRTNPPEMNDSHDADYGWHAPNGDQPNVNVIRARAFLPDGSASTNEIAGTWMIGPTVGEHLTNGLRVVSVITDRENYFGDPKGIMVPGDIYNEKGWASGQVGQPNANYFQRGADWERPAFVEMFDEKGVEMFSNKMGTRVHGNWSRAAAKKTLVCYSRKELGSKNIKLDKKKFRMFNDEPDLDKYKKYKRIMLRNGGNDWYKACLRDAVGQSMFRGYVNTGTQGYEPTAMYVNGEYWGVYNLRHAYSKQHFEEWNGAVEDDIDYVKLDPDSGDHFEVQEGDFTAMWDIMQYMISCTKDDKMDDAEYAVVSNQVDIADMIDFHIVNIFLCNADWIKNGNNMGYWRNRSGDDRKWHFTVYDCDSAMAYDGYSSADSDKLSVALNVNDTNDGAGKMAPGFLKRCFMNDSFKKRFANRYADLLNTALRVERTTNIVAQAAARIEPEIARTAARWTNMESSSKWKERLATFRAFFVNRPGYQWDHIQSHCDGGDYANITVAAEGEGKVKVNTIESGTHFQLPFRGKYFGNIPVTLTATPASGQAFAGWKIGDEIVSTEPTLTLAPTNGVTVQAMFAGSKPGEGVITGDYPNGSNVVLTADATIKIGNANFGGPLSISGGHASIELQPGTTARIPAITAKELNLTFDGAGTLVMSNNTTLITCADMTVSNGVLKLDFRGGAKKASAVFLKGDFRQLGGDIGLNVASDNTVYGIQIDKKEKEAYFEGGTFEPVLAGGEKSAAIKLEKGSSHANLRGGTTTVTMSGPTNRFVNTEGKVKVKGDYTAEIKSSGPDARVFKATKEITIEGGVITGEATGAGSEMFSSDDAIKVKGGVVSVEAADDCFSAATNVVVSAGKVQALSTAGDAIDSNGDVEISGGYVFATTRAADGYGIEADGEFIVSGGTVVAVGGPNVIHAPDEGSIACYMNANIASLKKYLVLTSDYLDRIEKLSVNLKSGEKRNADGFSLVAVVPNMYGTYSDTNTKPSDDKPKGKKLDDNLDGVFVTTVAKDTPSIVPGIEAVTYDNEEDATNAAAQVAVARPAAVAADNKISEEEYADLFDVKARQVAMNTWELVPELKESVSNEVQTAVDAATSNVTLMATLTTDAPTAKVTTQAGLYYGMAAADAVGDVGEALIPFERWVLGTGAEQELKSDKPGESAGFYQIRVQIEPPTK